MSRTRLLQPPAVFNIAINGQTVATNFDIVQQAGGSLRAVDRAYSVTAASGAITIQFTNVVDFAAINAIEITAAGGGGGELSASLRDSSWP